MILSSTTGLEKEWPVVRTQTRAALKQDGTVGEKILMEVKKKVRHAERVLTPALENATQARDTATQAQKTANSVAKVNWKWCLTQTGRSQNNFLSSVQTS